MAWEIVTVEKVTRDCLEDLFDNQIAAIRVPQFVDGETSRSIVDCVMTRGLEYYRDVDPPIGKIGITQFEQRHDGTTREAYFREAGKANAEREAIFATTEDPVRLVIDALAATWPDRVGIARESSGVSYFAGLVRVIGEALIHCDWAPFDAPSWSIGQIDAQITWNLYCQSPGRGGETLVYNRPWDPSAEPFHLINSYGYAESLIAGCQVARIRPAPASLVLFNSRNFHRVLPSSGSDRISVSSFVGRYPDGALALWS